MNTFDCEYCDKTYSHKRSLVRHIAENHNDGDNDNAALGICCGRRQMPQLMPQYFNFTAANFCLSKNIYERYYV